MKKICFSLLWIGLKTLYYLFKDAYRKLYLPHFFMQVNFCCVYFLQGSYICIYIRLSGMGRSDLGVIILLLAFQMTQQMKDNLRSTELGDGSRRTAWLMGLEESLSPAR